MSPSSRLLRLLAEPEVQLDRVAAVIGGLDNRYARADGASQPTVRVAEDAVVSTLDELASGLTGPVAVDDVIEHVFGRLGFRGNSRDYYNPANTIIQDVLQSRIGVPLTLSVVAMEVGRRAGAKLLAIGMPGHFLLAEQPGANPGPGPESHPMDKLHIVAAPSADDEPIALPSRFFDPFAAGRELDAAACQVVFEQLMNEQSFSPDMLLPVGPISIAGRMLQNLRIVYLRQGDVSRLASVLQLRVDLPGAAHGERLEYSQILGALGRYDQAAEELDRLAELEPERAKQHDAAAQRHRARRN